VSRCKTLGAKGLVIKGTPTPLKTTNAAERIFITKRIYGEISNLSSKTPTTREIKEAIKREIVIPFMGRKYKAVIKTPKKRGIPPPRGIGLV